MTREVVFEMLLRSDLLFAHTVVCVFLDFDLFVHEQFVDVSLQFILVRYNLPKSNTEQLPRLSQS